MDSSIGGERSDQEKQKRSLGCKHRGFTFSAKETKIGNKKKGGKKRWTCKTFGLSNSGVVTKISFFLSGGNLVSGKCAWGAGGGDGICGRCHRNPTIHRSFSGLLLRARTKSGSMESYASC
jgi:hypothetical protein